MMYSVKYKGCAPFFLPAYSPMFHPLHVHQTPNKRTPK
jgi:hypothetical protein